MSTFPSYRGLAISWLVLGLPIGGFIGWLAQISDRVEDRRFGQVLLALAALSLVLGIALLVTSRPALRTASLALSAGWAAAAVYIAVVADFSSDKLWGAGLTGLVAVGTAVLAVPRRRGGGA